MVSRGWGPRGDDRCRSVLVRFPHLPLDHPSGAGRGEARQLARIVPHTLHEGGCRQHAADYPHCERLGGGDPAAGRSRFQSIPGKTQTLPLAIYDHVQANAMPEANALSLIAVGTVLVILLVVGRLARVGN